LDDREVEARLKARGIDYIGPIPQLPGLLGIYFYDPNGIRLEFACQPEDGERPAVIAWRLRPPENDHAWAERYTPTSLIRLFTRKEWSPR